MVGRASERRGSAKGQGTGDLQNSWCGPANRALMGTPLGTQPAQGPIPSWHHVKQCHFMS